MGYYPITCNEPMIQVVFVRHGEAGVTAKSVWNHFLAQPTLTPMGFAQANLLGANLQQYFKFDFAVTSNLTRASETMDCIRAKYISNGFPFPPTIILDSLESVSRTQRALNPTSAAPVQLMWDRAQAAWFEILQLVEPVRPCRFLVVCHNATIQSMLFWAMGIPITAFRSFQLDFCAFCEVHFEVPACGRRPHPSSLQLRGVNVLPSPDLLAASCQLTSEWCDSNQIIQVILLRVADFVHPQQLQRACALATACVCDAKEVRVAVFYSAEPTALACATSLCSALPNHFTFDPAVTSTANTSTTSQSLVQCFEPPVASRSAGGVSTQHSSRPTGGNPANRSGIARMGEKTEITSDPRIDKKLASSRIICDARCEDVKNEIAMPINPNLPNISNFFSDGPNGFSPSPTLTNPEAAPLSTSKFTCATSSALPWCQPTGTLPQLHYPATPSDRRLQPI
jgi:broad specificity phosphatase PhoE